MLVTILQVGAAVLCCVVCPTTDTRARQVGQYMSVGQGGSVVIDGTVAYQ